MGWSKKENCRWRCFKTSNAFHEEQKKWETQQRFCMPKCLKFAEKE